MEHNIPLITTMAAGLAGILIGPATPGFVADVHLAAQLSEIGVVLLKALEARGVLDSMNGRIAVGWLVVENLATVLVLVLLPPLAGVLERFVPRGDGQAPANE